MSEHFTNKELFALIEKRGALSDEKRLHLEECDACKRVYQRMLRTEERLQGLQPFRAPDFLMETIVQRATRKHTSIKERTYALFLSLISLGMAFAWGLGLLFPKGKPGALFFTKLLSGKYMPLSTTESGLFYYLLLGLSAMTVYLLLDLYKKQKKRLFH